MNLTSIGLAVIREIAIPFIRNLVDTPTWRNRKEELLEATQPVFGELAEAAAGEGLLAIIVGRVIDDTNIMRRAWELRRPFDERATSILDGLGVLERT